MKKFILSFLITLTAFCTYAQVGIGTVNPHPSSMLEIESTEGGLLTPRMTAAQRMAISSPATGLLVFDIDESKFYYYNGVIWISLNTTNNYNDYSGWAAYVDGIYTSASPFSLTGSTKVTLPNAAISVTDSQKPIDVTTFYDSGNSTITGRNGDGINIVIEFKAKPTTSSLTRLTVSIDIGGAVGEIYPRDFVLAKGTGIEHYYLSSFNAYTLNTWEANGGAVKIISTAAVEIYDIRYVITRTHKAR